MAVLGEPIDLDTTREDAVPTIAGAVAWTSVHGDEHIRGSHLKVELH